MQGFTLKLSQVQRKPNFDVKINEVNGSRNIGQGHRVKVKGMSRTITLQGFTLAGIIDAEKTKLRCKNKQSQWTVKYRSKALGQDACLKVSQGQLLCNVSHSGLSLMQRKPNFDVTST